MSETAVEAQAAGRTRAPRHLWIVGAVALLWNAGGAFDYVATMFRLEPYMSQFSEEQLAYIYGFPAWVVSTWAIAVWGGLFGCVALLFRSRWAVGLFGLALVCFAATSIHNFALSEGARIMGTGGVIFSAVIAAVAVFLFLYARRLVGTGVLR